MLGSKEVRKIIVECFHTQDDNFIFSTTNLKELLKEKGYIYNKDYEVNAFNNAIYALAQKKYIVSTGEKGFYQLCKTITSDKREDKIKMPENQNISEREPELKNMRKKLMDCLNESCYDLAAILDAEKPSIYGKNRLTYDKATSLLNYLQSFSFDD